MGGFSEESFKLCWNRGKLLLVFLQAEGQHAVKTTGKFVCVSKSGWNKKR